MRDMILSTTRLMSIIHIVDSLSGTVHDCAVTRTRFELPMRFLAEVSFRLVKLSHKQVNIDVLLSTVDFMTCTPRALMNECVTRVKYFNNAGLFMLQLYDDDLVPLIPPRADVDDNKFVRFKARFLPGQLIP